MILLAIIGSVWLFCCIVAVALCVAASRADQYLSLVYAETDFDELTVDFVADLGEPAIEATPAPRPSQPARR
jgi:hypothetical protein